MRLLMLYSYSDTLRGVTIGTKHTLSEHLPQDTQNSLLTAYNIQEQGSKESSDPGCQVSVFACLQVSTNQMHDTRTAPTPSCSQQINNNNNKKLQKRKRAGESEEFLLDSSNTLASRTLEFSLAHLLKQNTDANLCKCEVRVRGMKIYCQSIFG